MKGLDPARLRRFAQRRGVRATLVLALGLPILVLAVPRLVPLPWASRAVTPPPFVMLESVWRRFEVDHRAASSSIDEFVDWVDGEAGMAFLEGVDPDADWSIQRTRDSVRLGTVVDALDAGSEPEWSLDVRRAPWAGVDVTLAATDLACVLCHARIDGEPPVRIVCAIPFEAGRDARVIMDGEITAVSDGLDAPDLVGALDAASHEPGTVDCAEGAIGLAAAAALAAGDFAPTRIDGEVDGPVVLVGTAERPIRLSGDVVIDGDLVLSGNVVGDGSLRVFGNVFVPGDIIHRGTGSVRVLVRGSVLVGEAYRPRRGQTLPVTGGPGGSFSFLVESIARFNGAIQSQSPRPTSLFTLQPNLAAPVLAAGARAQGDWHDPSLELVLDAPRRIIGPTPPPGATAPWLDPAALRRAMNSTFGGALGERATGTRLDAMFVVNGAFVAVAAGIDAWQVGEARVGSGLDAEPVAPGALELRGALIATHASVHAPAGLTIVDDPDARAAVRLPAVRGLVARLRGPTSSRGIESNGRRAGVGGPVRGLSMDPDSPADRLLAPGGLPPGSAREPATSR